MDNQNRNEEDRLNAPGLSNEQAQKLLDRAAKEALKKREKEEEQTNATRTRSNSFKWGIRLCMVFGRRFIYSAYRRCLLLLR